MNGLRYLVVFLILTNPRPADLKYAYMYKKRKRTDSKMAEHFSNPWISKVHFTPPFCLNGALTDLQHRGYILATLSALIKKLGTRKCNLWWASRLIRPCADRSTYRKSTNPSLPRTLDLLPSFHCTSPATRPGPSLYYSRLINHFTVTLEFTKCSEKLFRLNLASVSLFSVKTRIKWDLIYKNRLNRREVTVRNPRKK